MHIRTLPRSRPLIVTASALALLSVTAATPQADVTPPTKPGPSGHIEISNPIPAGFASWGAFIQVQNHLDTAANAIHELAAQPAAPGFGSLVVDQADRQLRLYWKGTPPARIGTIAAAMPVGYGITSLPARYDSKTLSTAVQRVVQTLRDAGITFASVAPDADSSGIEVDVPRDPGPATAALKDFAIATRVIPNDPSLTTARANPGPGGQVPVGPPRLQPGSPKPGRLYDSPLYWGGARWYAYTNLALPQDMCTAGFAVRQGDKTKLLTAGHCLGNGTEVFAKVAPGFEVFNHEGYVEQDLLTPGVASPDFELINPDTSGADGYMWQGGADPSTDSELPVWNSEFVDVGDYVCTNGAYSLKINCNGQVYNTGATAAYGSLLASGLAEAQSTDGQPLVVHGDSGGPVLFPWGWGAWSAQGIISSKGAKGDGDPVLGFTPIKDAESLYNATTITRW